MNRSLLTAMAATILVATAFVPDPTSISKAAFPGDNGVIAFTAELDGTQQIRTIGLDGTGLTTLTSSPDDSSTPSWSPDGRKIAFYSLRDNHQAAVYVMNGDGTAQTRLTNPDDWAFDPTWSPDGTRMAFVAGYVLTDLFVMNSDGSGRQQLTATSDPEYQPSWSPDGSKIAFTTYRNGNWDIFVVNADGSGESRLTTDEAQEGRPDWSPDGSKIAFDSYRSGSLDVWVMNADGSDVTRLTYGTYDYSYFPVWSPDGTKIAFTYDDGTGTGNKEIYSMNPDGTGRYRVTDTQEPNLLPDWQPIGGGPTMTPRPVAVGGRLGLLDSKSYEDQSSSSARHAQPRVVVVALPALLISLTLFAYVTRRHTRCRL